MKYPVIYGGLALLLIYLVLLSLASGAINVPIESLLNILDSYFTGKQISQDEIFLKDILVEIRIPRIIFCTVIGGVLGITGTAIQGIFRNPLAEPGLIGISAGASFFAALAIVFESFLVSFLGDALNMYLISIAAFIGACIAVIMVYQISVFNGKPSIATMILAGIAINALAGAATGLMSYMASEQQLRNITFWSLGSMAGATWKSAQVLLIFASVAVVPLLFFGKSLNLFSLGESQAEMMGLNVKKLKLIIIICSALAVGASVAFAGVIAFVGLLVPHSLRLIGSVDNRFLLPSSLIGGAIVINFSDLVARVVIQPLELPIGVITALIGAPVFLLILIREKKKL